MHCLGLGPCSKHEKVVRSILNEQREDGSWDVYHGAPCGDINTTVECYAALRACGLEKESEALRRARLWIMENGGLGGIRNFTKYWLALIGEWPWEQTPALPPEIISLPSWIPFNIYRFASWARGTIVPLSILSARRPVRPLPEDRRLDELFPRGRANFDFRLPLKQGWASWEKCLLPPGPLPPPLQGPAPHSRARDGHKGMHRMDHPAPGTRRHLVRNPAPVDLFSARAPFRRLQPRPSRHEKRPCRLRQPLVLRTQRRQLSPGERIPHLGHRPFPAGGPGLRRWTSRTAPL